MVSMWQRARSAAETTFLTPENIGPKSYPSPSASFAARWMTEVCGSTSPLATRVKPLAAGDPAALEGVAGAPESPRRAGAFPPAEHPAAADSSRADRRASTCGRVRVVMGPTPDSH